MTALALLSLLVAASCALAVAPPSAALLPYGTPVPLPPPTYLSLSAEELASISASTLRQAAAAHGVFIGTAANYYHLTNQSDPTYKATIVEEYDLTTAENSCKFGGTQPNAPPAPFTFADCDALAQFTTGADAGTFRGHNTVWGIYNPSWLTNYTAQQLQQALVSHVSTVLGHYGSQTYCWDVVNEAVSDSSDPSLVFKPGTWYPAIPDYVDLAFTTAAASAPADVKLFYNDYNWEGYSSVKAAKIRGMLSAMKAKGIRVDGVGFQMHVSVDSYPDPADVSKNMAALAEMGLEVHITEMDVRCVNCTEARLQTQASIYGQMLSACLANKNCKSFETWGYTDRYTWLWDFENPNHDNVMPLPFDINYGKKPAYVEMLAVLAKTAPLPDRW